jgi:hypothetical protein
MRGVVEIHSAIRANLESVIRGKPQPIRWLLASFLSGGHVLLEDFPGTGKTTLAKALAKSVAADYKRIQFTPDLLPRARRRGRGRRHHAVDVVRAVRFQRRAGAAGLAR